MSDVVLWIGGGMVAVAVVLILIRIEKGPSMLDRTIGLDMLVGTVVVVLALISAVTGRTDLVNVLVVLALVGFVGSVTLARFVAVESDDEGKILSPEELAATDERGRAALEREQRRTGAAREDEVRRAGPEAGGER